jgi:alkylation response protein AidB-like acyl-CoA dehydrogenase
MGVDSLLRDAVPACIFSGTSEMQRMIIAKMLGVA